MHEGRLALAARLGDLLDEVAALADERDPARLGGGLAGGWRPPGGCGPRRLRTPSGSGSAAVAHAGRPRWGTSGRPWFHPALLMLMVRRLAGARRDGRTRHNGLPQAPASIARHVRGGSAGTTSSAPRETPPTPPSPRADAHTGRCVRRPPPPTPSGARSRRTSRETTTGTRAEWPAPRAGAATPGRRRPGALPRATPGTPDPPHRPRPRARRRQCPRRQRHPVIAPLRVLHPPGRNRPGPPLEIDLLPLGQPRLARTHPRQHHQLERQPHRPPGAARPHPCEHARNLAVGKCPGSGSALPSPWGACGPPPAPDRRCAALG